MQTMYRFGKAHFVEALTGTVLKKAGVKLPTERKQSIAKAIRKVILFDPECAEIFSYMDEQRIWHMPLKGVILQDIPRNNYCEKNPAGSVGKVLNYNGQMMSE